MSEVIQHLRGAVLPWEGAGLTDGQLLACYLDHGEQAALAALVRRHGPMVWGVCRRVLRNRHDAEDAFQATFLVLVRRAASILSRDRVANWLHGVADRTARKARVTAAKRDRRERSVTELPEPEVVPQDDSRELHLLLDQEVRRLPEKYRTTILLCDLGGRTRQEAARQLGCPEGTVAGRLARARAMLAKRLNRHGLAFSAVALATAPPSLLASTVEAAGGAATSVPIPAKVVALAGAVMKSMFVARMMGVMAVVTVVGLVFGGIGAGIGVFGGYWAIGQSGPPGNAPTVLAAAPVAPEAGTVALTGIVRAEKGKPLAGALVRIWTAGPRKGAGELCPSCYPDCKKKAVTDARGAFTLKDLDPHLVYNLVIVAKGHVAASTSKTDPASGPVTVTLKPHDLDRRDPALIVNGRVLDEKGRPVADATVAPNGLAPIGVTRTSGGRRFGKITEADPLAVTDEDGRFRIGLTKEIGSLFVTVRAPFLAPRQSGPLAPGKKSNEVKLVSGVTVGGKVVKDGKALAGVTLRLRQNMVQDANRKRDRTMVELAFEIDTDAQGNFRFDHVPPDEDYVLLGVMDSFRAHGVLRTRKVVAKGNRATCELGDLPVEKGHTLSGKIILEDGKAVPAGTRVIYYRREEAGYDYQVTTAGSDGGFTFTGVPDELCQLEATVKGYRTSTLNYCCDRYYGYGLWGRVDQDITDLRYLLEPGVFATKNHGDKDIDALYQRRLGRLQGAPAAP